VTQLERELEAVKARLPAPNEDERWWMAQIGCFKDDEAHAEVMEIIRKNREKDYAKARREDAAARAREQARVKKAREKTQAKKARPAKARG
jgi:hypothetical protein